MTPSIASADAGVLVRLVKLAFGATGDHRPHPPASLHIGDRKVMTSDSETCRARTAFLYTYAPDPDQMHRRAVATGA